MHMSKERADYRIESEEEAWITRCVVDTTSRSFRLLSNQGHEKFVVCDSLDEFVNVLNACRNILDQELVYADPLVTEK